MRDWIKVILDVDRYEDDDIGNDPNSLDKILLRLAGSHSCDRLWDDMEAKLPNATRTGFDEQRQKLLGFVQNWEPDSKEYPYTFWHVKTPFEWMAYNHKTRPDPFDDWEYYSSDDPYSILDGHELVSVAYRLASVIQNAISNRPIVEETALSGRQERYTKVNVLIGKLKKELELLSKSDSYKKIEFFHRRQFLRNAVDLSPVPFQRAIKRPSAAEIEAVKYANRITLSEPNIVLDYFDGIIKDWSRQPPESLRPKDTNAGRLRLIRRLNRFFKSNFQRPYHDHVLNIVCIFFPDALNNLSVDDIRKLTA